MSRRRAFRLLLVFGLAASAVAPTALGQQTALDKVHYRAPDGEYRRWAESAATDEGRPRLQA